MKAAVFAFALLVAGALVTSCIPPASAGAPVEAPAWSPIAFGAGNADIVAAFDLEALRSDVFFGPIMKRLAEKERLGVLMRATQVDILANVDHGRQETWVGIVHGVDGPPTERDVGSNARDIVPVPGAWILGEGPAFDRVRAQPALASSTVAMPTGAVFAATGQGRAIPHPDRREIIDLTENLVQVTTEVLGGAGTPLGVACSCRYADAASAKRAATIARLVLVSAAAREDDVAAMARALMKVDFDVSGDTVSVRVILSDDLRDALAHYVDRAVD